MTNELKCSRAGCEKSASFYIHWRNPKIHTADRIKVWLSCESHRQYFVDYLSMREFFLEAKIIE